MKLNRNLFYLNNISFLSYVIFAIFIILIQNLFLNDTFLQGLFVSDALSLTATYNNLFASNNFNIFDLDYTYLGLYYVYYFFEGYYWIPNLLFIYLSFILLNKLFFNLYGNYSNKVVFLLLLNPYNLLVINYINKEIVLQFLIILFFYYFFKDKKLITILFLSTIVFFIRDAYGAILLGFYIFSIIFKNNFKIGIWIAFILLYVVQLFIFQFSDFPLIERNLDSTNNSFEHSSQILQDAQGIFYFLYKIIGNIVSLSLRPAFVTSTDGIFLLGIGYYFLGWVLLLTYVINIYGILTTHITYKFKLIFYFQIFSLLMVSQSFFIMPRYLFPFLPIYLLLSIYILKNHKYKYYNNLLYLVPFFILCAVIVLIYFNMNIVISI
ncbi:hypothetical protein AN286_06985 [Aliarcobacter cryaerophilus ATCC 43158]|uniref:Membrane protein n=1 Tax=Aliarcobacter cryaerophilus ATCC 43158 TaxID=1032070 RepID=A0AAD0XA58_9BACT|nr:putative membrane protein [Aliarcobacter cryaerophilus ATCC 43158]PRM96871.1 hypothetical protein CJ667_06595 [Aliarcobacter cryaerophilus]QCZ24145.1 hypothetical protein AN286_06985 [Aliarcobacter cryaerophilus ATCC 43158]